MFESIATLTLQIRALDDEISHLATNTCPQAQLLTQVPGVGNLTALAYLLTLGAPQRFTDSRIVGAYLGLAPGRRQSGDRDQPTRITTAGDEQLRWLLVQSANHILRRDDPDTDLKRHEQKLAKSGSNERQHPPGQTRSSTDPQSGITQSADRSIGNEHQQARQRHRNPTGTQQPKHHDPSTGRNHHAPTPRTPVTNRGRLMEVNAST